MLRRAGVGFATQAERVAALVAQDEAAWRQPDQPGAGAGAQFLDLLRRYQTPILIGAGALFVLAILKRR
jgi:hypothetical protein